MRSLSFLVDVAGVLVGAVGAVWPVVAEELLVDALAVAALQLLVWAHRLVRLQVRQRLSGTLNLKNFNGDETLEN